VGFVARPWLGVVLFLLAAALVASAVPLEFADMV
jgi:hypothetical protein